MTSKIKVQQLQWQTAGVLAVQRFRMLCIMVCGTGDHFGRVRAVASCRRRYEYLLPAFAFDSNSDGSGTQGAAGLDTAAQQQPAPPAGVPQAEGQSPVEGFPSPGGGRGDFVLDGARRERLNGILAQFKGTHSFHNYTVKVAPQSRSRGGFWQAAWGPVASIRSKLLLS